MKTEYVPLDILIPSLAISSSTSSAVLMLPNEVTADNIENIKKQIRKINLKSRDSLILDASATRMISVSGIQLLLAIEDNLKKQDSSLVLKNVSGMVGHIFQAMGLKEKLEKWSKNNS